MIKNQERDKNMAKMMTQLDLLIKHVMGVVINQLMLLTRELGKSLMMLSLMPCTTRKYSFCQIIRSVLVRAILGKAGIKVGIMKKVKGRVSVQTIQGRAEIKVETKSGKVVGRKENGAIEVLIGGIANKIDMLLHMAVKCQKSQLPIPNAFGPRTCWQESLARFRGRKRS